MYKSYATIAKSGGIADIESRSDNLVIYKLPEPATSITDGQARKQADLVLLKEVLSIIDCAETEGSVTNSFRPAKVNDDISKPCPQVLTLSNSHHRSQILSKAKLLAKSKF